MIAPPFLATRLGRRTLLPLCCSVILLGGCAATPAPASIPDSAVPSTPTPSQPAHNDARFSELQTQIDQLKQQLVELQQRQTALGQWLSTRIAMDGTTPTATGNSNGRLQQAQQQYRAGLYAQAVRTLAGVDGGGDGGIEAQNSMHVLMQSHWRLNNCESVINIGNRFAGRFGRNPQAAEALWLVGQCQWRMQQQDIARETWRKITRTYPDSAAAKRAWQRLNTGK